MPVRLYNLRGVPDDEAEEMRQVLQQAEVDFYETPPGNWGISAPAFWLNDAAQLDDAKNLIQQYQEQRALRAREERERLRREGKEKTIIDAFREEPLKFSAYAIAALVVLYFSSKPFLDIGS